MASSTTLAVASSPTTARIATRWVVVALFVVALVPLFTTPVLPFIDLYNHIARFFVLAHLGSNPALAANYASNWSILPNIGLDVVGTLALRVVSPEHAAHAVVVAVFALQYGGVLYFNRQLTGRTSPIVALLLVPLLYSFILNWGFANFLAGLGLVFWGAGWWLAKRDRLAVALPVACVFAVAIFLTHGLAFVLYGVLVGALEVGLWLAAPQRPIGGLIRRLVPVAAQALIPVALFALAATSKTATGLSSADESVARLQKTGALAARLWELCLYRLMTIVRVEEGPSLWFDAATLIVQVAVVGGLIAAGRARIVRTAWPAIVGGVVLVVVVPPAILAVGYVADRMPLFLAMTLVGSLDFDLRGSPRERAAIAVLGIVVAVRLAAIAVDWQGYATDYTAFARVAPLIPRGALVNDIVVGGAPRDSDARRCSMYRPLLISEHGAIGPLFADVLKQPLRLAGPLAAAVAALPPGRASGEVLDYYSDLVARSGAAGFDYLLVCNADRLAHPLPTGVTTIAHTPRFDLLRLAR